MPRGLCKTCEGITFSSLFDGEGYTHLPSGSLSINFESCRLCLSLYYASRNLCRHHGHYKLSLVPTNYNEKLQWGRLYIASTCFTCGAKAGHQVPVDNVSVMTSPGDLSTIHGIGASRVLSNTASRSTFQFIKDQIDLCHTHYDCKPFTSSETIRGPIHNVTGECPSYVTLSHCWGGGLSPEGMTTQSTLASRQAGIQYDSLPRTFRDVVDIARQLDQRYVWINALCIIQDSAQDWAAESVKMGSIFGNSALTIAAASSKDSNGGCFNVRSKSQAASFPNLIQLSEFLDVHGRPTSDQSGKPSTISILPPNNMREPSPLESSTLSARGWVFQERLLSPRTLHFTSSQVVWECRETYAVEEEASAWYSTNSTVSSFPLQLKPGISSKGSALNSWYFDLIERDYSRRNFTVAADRLIAISGVARMMKSVLDCSYLAGLWEFQLCYGLAWDARATNQSRTVTRSGNGSSHRLYHQRRYPSWSWASHDFDVSWYHIRDFSLSTDFRFLKSSLRTADLAFDPFGPVTWCSIDVEALFIRCALTMISDAPTLKSEDGKLLSAVALDYDPAIADGLDHPVYCIILSRAPCIVTLLLETFQDSPESYVRIGICEIPKTANSLEWIESAVMKTITIV